MEFSFSLRKRLQCNGSYPTISYDDPSEFHYNTPPSFTRYFHPISGSSRDKFYALQDDYPLTTQNDSKYSYSQFTSYSRSEYVSAVPTASHYGSPESPPATAPDSEPPYPYSPRPNTQPPQNNFSPRAIRAVDKISSPKTPQLGANPLDLSPPEHVPIQAKPAPANPGSSYNTRHPTYTGPYYKPPDIRPEINLFPRSFGPDPYNPHSYRPESPTTFPSQPSIPCPLNINTGRGINDSGNQRNGDVNIDYGNQQNGGVKIVYKVIHVKDGDYIVHKKRRRGKSRSRMPSHASGQRINSYSYPPVRQNYYNECHKDSMEISCYNEEEKEDDDEETDEYIICGTVDSIANIIRQDVERERRATKEEGGSGTSPQCKIDISSLQGHDREKLMVALP